MNTKEKKLAPSSNDKSRLVQMRIQPKTYNSIENLSKMTGTTNRTQLISTSIQLTEEIFNRIEAGSKVYIEGKDGQRELLTIVGL